MGLPGETYPLSRFLLIAAAIVFIAWGINQANAVVVWLLLAAFLALLATPPMHWLERHRLPRAVAVALVVGGMILIVLVIGAVVGASINSFYGALPQYQARIQEQVAALQVILAKRNIVPQEQILLDYLNPGAVMSLTAGLLVRLGSTLSNVVLIILTATFILLEAATFPGKLRAVIGDPHQAFPRFVRFIADMKRYMVIKTVFSLATGVLVAALLFALRVDFPVLWGFLAFVLNYVPTIGSLVAAIPAVFLTFVQFGFWRAAIAAAGYCAINLALAYGIEARLMGRRLGLSTLVVFLSLMFWGSLLGPIGAVLCIPLTLSLKFALASSDTTRWIAVLLEPEVPAGRTPSAPSKELTRPAPNAV